MPFDRSNKPPDPDDMTRDELISEVLLWRYKEEQKNDLGFTVLNCLTFTKTERLITELLLERAGRIVPREQFEALCSPIHEVVDIRTIDSHIKRIRMRLRAHGSKMEIFTQYGMGYYVMKDCVNCFEEDANGELTPIQNRSGVLRSVTETEIRTLERETNANSDRASTGDPATTGQD